MQLLTLLVIAFVCSDLFILFLFDSIINISVVITAVNIIIIIIIIIIDVIVAIFGAIIEYLATAFTYVGVLWRTRYITIVAFLCNDM